MHVNAGITIVVAAFLVAGGSSRASAQRRPRWLPPSPVVQAFPRPPRIIIEPHRPRKTVPTSGLLEGPVAVDATGAVTFLGDDGVLGHVLPDGTLSWSLLVGPPGGSPAVGGDGTVYCAGRDQRLYAVGSGGQLLWSRFIGGRPVRGVAVAHGRVALALDTGRLELWDTDGAKAAIFDLGGAASAAPVLAGRERVLVPMESGFVLALDGTRVAWRTRLAASAIAPPGLDSDGALIAGAADGTVAKMDRAGTIVWRANAGGPISRSPALAENGTVFFAAGSTLVAYSQEGVERWRRSLPGTIVAGPLVAEDGSVFVASAGRRGAGAGEIEMFDESGEPQRTTALPAAPTRSLTLAPGSLWIGLADLTLHRIPVPESRLARSGWPKARGDLSNSGAL